MNIHYILLLRIIKYLPEHVLYISKMCNIPVIFDFHHRNPEKKEFVWAKMKLKSDEKILSELDKCDLLCSNCHRKGHHEKREVI